MIASSAQSVISYVSSSECSDDSGEDNELDPVTISPKKKKTEGLRERYQGGESRGESRGRI
jgi:hypothetical protein